MGSGTKVIGGAGDSGARHQKHLLSQSTLLSSYVLGSA
jgi:hypothetical protein